ncbi:MAG: 50S ribosomal protein L11 methyltransferase, partial [Pedosphaera parvula]|nr:50S ribosomal protein L11 methyltransferase [Pedosphaera parvula]
LYDLLVTERSRIIQRVHPRGRLVLAGILRTQYRAVRAAYLAAGWAQVCTAIEKEWQSGAFMFQRKTTRPSSRKQ